MDQSRELVALLLFRAGWASGHSLPCNVAAVVQLHPLPLVPLLDLPRLTLIASGHLHWVQTPWCTSSKTAQDSTAMPCPNPLSDILNIKTTQRGKSS